MGHGQDFAGPGPDLEIGADNLVVTQEKARQKLGEGLVAIMEVYTNDEEFVTP